MEIALGVISVLSFLLSLTEVIKTDIKDKRKETIAAYDALENTVINKLQDMISAFSDGEAESFKNGKTENKDVISILSDLEAFSRRVNKRIYSINALKRLGCEKFIYAFDTLSPVIKRYRESGTDSGKAYKEFEKTAAKLKKKLR